MEYGNFYFLTDQYFIDFPDPQLMKNHEQINGQLHDRPCFFAIKDKQTGLYWMIPFSSKTAKYHSIYNHKTANGKPCDTIVFGYVLGHEKAFLIQNICPVTEQYIASNYVSGCTPVKVKGSLEKELTTKASKVLTLQRKGVPLIFPDVLPIEKQLLQNGTK